MTIAGVVAAVGLVLTIVTLPEPRGKSLEELTAYAYAEEPAPVGQVQPALGGLGGMKGIVIWPRWRNTRRPPITLNDIRGGEAVPGSRSGRVPCRLHK